jgi:hypothetical protein
VPLDPFTYTGRHVSPAQPTWVQLIAYERRDGSWDLFVFEPVGICPPEWEEHRIDAQHVRVGELSTLGRLDEAARLIHAQLGAEYEPIAAFREPRPGVRGGVNLRLQRLHHAGATGYSARLGADGHWELWARRKDLHLLGE